MGHISKDVLISMSTLLIESAIRIDFQKVSSWLRSGCSKEPKAGQQQQRVHQAEISG